jgi:filamentous hemagglutinin family protein
VVVRLSRKLRVTYRIRTGPCLSHLLLAVLSLTLPSLARALPQGPVVEAGAATVSTPSGSSMVINQTTSKAVLGWQSFNIGQGQSVQFVQPGAASVALNRVLGGDVSSIFGTLSANGQVFLLNPAGVMFAPGAQVNVGGLVASSLNLSNADFMAGNYQFSGAGGSVVNHGNIQGGYVVLAAPDVANHGAISAPGGSVGLLAGSRVTVDPTGGGLVKFSVDAAAVNAVAANTGTITVDGGKAAVMVSSLGDTFSTVLNQSGVIRANSIANQNGTIVLDGGPTGIVKVSGTLEARGAQAGETGGSVKVLGERVGLMAGTRIDASGDAGGGTVLVGGNFQGKGPERNAKVTLVHDGAGIDASARTTGNGGTVIVWADDTTRYHGAISTTGGAVSGNGGFVEVSGKNNLAFTGAVDTGAANGTVGTVLLDPANITIVAGAGANDAEVVDTAVAFADGGAGNFQIGTTAIQNAVGQVVLQASNDVTVNGAINKGNGGLTVMAGNDINVNANITASTAIFLNANYSGTPAPGASTAGKVTVGAGVTLSGANVSLANDFSSTANVVNGALTATGDINLFSSTNFGAAATLNATNLNINAGSTKTVTLGASNAISNTTNVVVSSGTTLAMGAFSDTVANVTLESGTINGTGTLTAGTYTTNNGTINANLGTGTLTSTGAVTLNGTSAASAVNVTGGTLNLGPTAARLTGAGAAITISNGATLNTGNAGQGLGGGTGTVVNNGALVTGAGISAASIAGTGTTSLGGAVTTTGAQTYGAVTLTNAVTLTGSNVTVNGAVSGANTLAINSAGATALNGAVNIASLVTDAGGTTSLNNVTTTGLQTYGDNVTLNGSYATNNAAFTVGGTTTLAGSSSVNAGAAVISFGSTVAGTAGTESLSTSNTGNLTFGGAISNLNNLTIAGGPIFVALPTTTLTGTLDVTSAGTIGQTGAVSAALVRGTTAAQFNLNNAGNSIGSLGPISASGVSVKDASGGLTLTGPITATTGSISIETNGGTLAVGGNAVQSGSNISLTALGATGDITTSAGGTVTATDGFIDMIAGRNLALGATVSANGAAQPVELRVGVSTDGAFSTTAAISSNGGTTIRGGGSNDSFDFSNAPAFNATVDGAAGNNTLTGRNTAATYTLTAVGAGNGDGLTFTNIGALVGGSANDTFTLASGVTFAGTLAGGGGTNTLAATDGTNAWAITGANAGTLNGMAFSAMANLTGGSGTDTLTGRNNATAWSVTGARAVTVEGMNASNMEALAGGALNDTFTLAGGVPSFNGAIAGGGGTDTLAATDGANAWAITGANTGTLNTSTTFTAITHLAGGSGADTFTFADAGSVTGTLAGGGTASVDTVDLSAKTGLVAINTQTGVATGSAGTSGMEAFIGNGANTTLTGAAFSLTGVNSGTADAGLAYSGVANLQGAAVANTIAGNGGSVSGTITSGAAGATLSGTITSTGAQTYNGAVTLGAATTLAASSVNLTGTVGGAQALTINSSGATTLGGAVNVASLATDAAGSTSIGANVTTTGAQSYGDAVTLTADVVLASSGGGAINFGNTINGAQALTLNTAGATSLGGAVGSTSALTSLTTNAGGTTSLGGPVTTTGAQSYGDDVTATAPVTVASTGGGNVSFLGTLAGTVTINTTGTIVRPAVVVPPPASTTASTASTASTTSGAGGLASSDAARLSKAIAAAGGDLTEATSGNPEDKVLPAGKLPLHWSYASLQKMMTPLNFGSGTVRRAACSPEQGGSGACQ